jgi:flavin-dependent dehydrogenase
MNAIMNEIFDVLVVGGGPAGATVALCLARRGCRVALLEATAYGSHRYGETLPPEINPVLRELKLWNAFQNLSPLEAPGMISAWGDPTPIEVDFVRNVHGTGWHIDRKSFDQMLVNEAEKEGVQVRLSHRIQACTRDGEFWRVRGLRSRVLVDASGRNGLRLDDNGARETDDRLIAIALAVSCAIQQRKDLRTSIESTPSGWWYTAALPDRLAVAMFFTDPVIYREAGISIREQLEHAPMTAQYLKGGKVVSSSVLHVTSSCRGAIFGARWIAVGDSACSLDPISGRGIFKAIRHAEAASTAVIAALDGNMDSASQYARQIREEYGEYVRQRKHYYSSEQRWPEQPFWRERRNAVIPR